MSLSVALDDVLLHYDEHGNWCYSHNLITNSAAENSPLAEYTFYTFLDEHLLKNSAQLLISMTLNYELNCELTDVYRSLYVFANVSV